MATRMTDTVSDLDFSLASAISPHALAGAPDLSFADAIAAPMRKYKFSLQLVVDMRLKVEQLSYDDKVVALGLNNDEISTSVFCTHGDSSGAEKRPYHHAPE